jgi:C-terminal processing protease CtpA/Prc
MKPKFSPIPGLVVLLAFLFSACQAKTPVPVVPTFTASPPTATKAAPTLPIPSVTPTPLLLNSGQTTTVSGDFTYTNDILITYYAENAVSLYDMHGFIVRDKEWQLPLNSQVLGWLKINTSTKRGTYHLELPAQPEGTINDVSHRNQPGEGVQVFAVAYAPNLAGGPFYEGDDVSLGWPTYLASVETDPENKDEVTGGKLVVWAPDGNQLFPTGFGTDGLLFTDDDPVAPLPAGYSVIDLGLRPFGIDRREEETLTLYEPKNIALKDFSNLSFSAGFKQAFDIIRQQYAFNGIAEKQPNWDSLYAAIAPRIQDAETQQDVNAYYAALVDFTLAFKDGHVGISDGNAQQQYLIQRLAYGYGLAARELDDGSVIVVYLLDQGPAQKAGVKVGAKVISVNGTPVANAISAIPLLQPSSTDYGKRFDQVGLLFRGARNAQLQLAFQNPSSAVQTASLSAVTDVQSYLATLPDRNVDPNALPVEFKILSSNIGYVKINSYFDDLNLIIRLFERALTTFQNNQVGGIIIDLRINPGGNPLGLAGFLTNQTITEGTTEYYSSETGKFEPEGPPDKIIPMAEQYHFNKMALLVDLSCYSACELEAYGFSQVSGMMVVGMYPTGGTEAEVSRGQFKLPGGVDMQVPTGRIVKPDGSLFLEGTGVQPTIKVPITAANVLSTDDVVLNTAVQQILK